MNSLLYKGYGTPAAVILNSAGNIITDRFGNPISRFISMFKYTFDQDDGDECSITFKTDDPYFLDNPYLRMGVTLLVRWGYIGNGNYNIMGRYRKISINNVDPNYGNDGITIDLSCKAFSDYFRRIKEASSASEGLLDFMDKVCKGKYRWSVSRNGYLLYSYGKNPNYTSKNTGQLVTARDNATKAFQAWIEDYNVYIDAGRDPHLVLKNKLNYAPGGPYTVEYRDDEVNIKEKYNFNQAPSRYYKYKGGTNEIISFHPTSSDDLPDMVEANMNSLDPLKKEIEGLKSNLVPKPKVESNISNNRKSDTDNEDSKEKNVPSYGNGYYSFKGSYEMSVDQHVYEFLNNTYPDYYDKWYKGVAEDGTIILKEGAPAPPVLSIDLKHFATTWTLGNDGYNKMGLDREFHVGMTVVPMSVIMSSPQVKQLKENIDNSLKEAFCKKYTADLTIIGDPLIESDIMINISGVARVNAGDWYVKKATHIISAEEGFKVDMDIVLSPTDTDRVNYTIITKMDETGKETIDIKSENEKLLESKKFSTLAEYQEYLDKQFEKDKPVVKSEEDIPEKVVGDMSTADFNKILEDIRK